MPKYNKPVWQMVKEAVEELGELTARPQSSTSGTITLGTMSTRARFSYN